MANAIINAGDFNSDKETLDRCPKWFLWNIQIDTNNDFEVLLDPWLQGAVLLDGILNTYQAEAGATSSSIAVRINDGSSPVTKLTWATDAMGSVGLTRPTGATPAVPLVPASSPNPWALEVGGVIVGSPSTPALAQLGLLIARFDY